MFFGIDGKGVLPVFIESNFGIVHSGLINILVCYRYGLFAAEGIYSAAFHTFDKRYGLVYLKAIGTRIGNIACVVGQAYINNILPFSRKVYRNGIITEFRRILDRLFA